MKIKEMENNDISEVFIDLVLLTVIFGGTIWLTASSAYKLGKIAGANKMVVAVSEICGLSLDELAKISVLETVGIKL